MKTNKRLLLVIICALLLLNANVFAQEEVKRPEYITVTTMHWNMDRENFDMDEWKIVEKEFLDKVTMKNEHIMSSSFYLHNLTADNTELLYVQTYKSWDAIDKASERNSELIKEAWADETARKAANKKRMGYYADTHSDEIYATMSGAKLVVGPVSKDMLLYVRKSHFAFPEDGSMDEFNALRNESIEKVVHKNQYVKGYYPNSHAYGSDRTEYVEAFYVDSLADLDKMFDRGPELAKEAWPDEKARKERGKKYGKYFTGVHSDFVYSYVPELSKIAK